MKIKKYIASSFNEGKKRILAELGEDAVILSTRNTTKPESGEPIVEIVAAIDEKQIKSGSQRPVKDKLSGLESVIQAAREEAKKDSPTRATNYSPKYEVDELQEIKNSISDIFDILKYKHTASLGINFGKLYKNLIDNDFTEEYTLDLINQISSENPGIEYEDSLSIARDKLIEKIKLNSPIQKTNKRQVISFVGNTGSGKTLSLIKLAIVMNLLGSKVQIVSTDTYKIGGAEQLQTFASIAGIPFKSVYNLKEMKKIINDDDEFEFIFIDTKGISQKNFDELKDIENFLKIAKPDRTLLCLSANFNYKTIEDIIGKFLEVNPTDIILTKLDETESYGQVISCLQKFSMPITYVSYGQKVPDDLAPANRKILARLALKPKNSYKEIKELFND